MPVLFAWRPSRTWAAVLTATASVLSLIDVSVALAQDAQAATAPAAMRNTYRINDFDFTYFTERNDQLPSLVHLEENASVKLSLGGDVVDVGAQSVRLQDLPDGQYTLAALKAIADSVVQYYNSQGYYAVKVGWSPEQIDPNTQEDLRAEGDEKFTFIVVVPRITDVRTLAFGDRIAAVRRTGAQEHSRILQNSPLRASAAGSDTYFQKQELDDYVFRLNRHPGRRVDVAVSGGAEPGDLTLDYLVSENRPWYMYAQVSNTGTESTNEWRERFGFTHNQLTGRDDIFSIDYSTAGFEDSHSVTASYDFPIVGSYDLRSRLYASWSNFTASDVGLVDQEFEGTEWSGGGELAWNFFQKRDAFLDLIGGLRYQNVEIDNTVDSISVSQGRAEFWQPYVGLRYQRITETANTFGSVTLNYGWTPADQEELDALRQSSDDTFWTLNAVASHSFYLEPIVDRRDFEAGRSTLAHEVYLSARGQYAFDRRLIPQIEETAGGLYSVRGYPESITAGDNVLIASAEYRFHLPRALAPQPGSSSIFGRPFRWRPQDPYSRPDWDLIFRPFIDYARVTNSDRLPFENDNTLIGTGVGVELQVLNNFNARFDWGFALTDVDSGSNDDVEAGDNRLSVSFTFVY